MSECYLYLHCMTYLQSKRVYDLYFECYVLGLYISGSLLIAFLNGTSKSHKWASTGWRSEGLS